MYLLLLIPVGLVGLCLILLSRDIKSCPYCGAFNPKDAYTCEECYCQLRRRGE